MTGSRSSEGVEIGPFLGNPVATGFEVKRTGVVSEQAWCQQAWCQFCFRPENSTDTTLVPDTNPGVVAARHGSNPTS
jgi:hypothetical protein